MTVFNISVYTDSGTWQCSIYIYTGGRFRGSSLIHYANPSPDIVGRKVGNFRRQLSPTKATVCTSVMQYDYQQFQVTTRYIKRPPGTSFLTTQAPPKITFDTYIFTGTKWMASIHYLRNQRSNVLTFGLALMRNDSGEVMRSTDHTSIISNLLIFL